MFQDGLPAEKTTNKINLTIKPEKSEKQTTAKSGSTLPKKVKTSAAKTAASKLEERAKTAISKRKKAPKTKDEFYTAAKEWANLNKVSNVDKDFNKSLNEAKQQYKFD